MTRYAVILAAIALWLVPLSAGAQQLDLSWKKLASGSANSAQMFRCNATDSPDSQVGEVCTSGNWTPGLDCRGKTQLTVRFHEYGAGSAAAKVWDCDASARPFDPTRDPAAAADATHNGCHDMLAAAGLSPATMDGTTLTYFSASDISLGVVVMEVDNCTGACTSYAVASCQ